MSKRKYKALVNIGANPPIKAGEIFDGDQLKGVNIFINAGQIVAVKEKEVKKEEVK